MFGLLRLLPAFRADYNEADYIQVKDIADVWFDSGSRMRLF